MRFVRGASLSARDIEFVDRGNFDLSWACYMVPLCGFAWQSFCDDDNEVMVT
jgi:hypothetical protein